MKTVNLKELYPERYSKDTFIQLEDDIVKVIEDDKKQQEAYRIKTLRHKAYYSIDLKNNIADTKNIEESVINEELNKYLYKAISKLSKKQQRRIYAYYFLNLKKTDIAKLENVSEKNVLKSIDTGLAKMRKFLIEILTK